MDKDDRLSEDYIKDIYWDVDLKKAEEDFKNNGYKFRENDDLEKLPTAKKSDPPTSKVVSPKKATVTKNKPGPKWSGNNVGSQKGGEKRGNSNLRGASHFEIASSLRHMLQNTCLTHVQVHTITTSRVAAAAV